MIRLAAMSTSPPRQIHDVQIFAIAQQQRHGQQRRKFHRGRDVAIAPGKIPRPVRVPRIEADVGKQQH